MFFQGRTAVVSGSARGIGQAVCRALAVEGANVVVTDINAAGAAETAYGINQRYGSAMAVTCDVSSDADVASLKSAALERFGAVDILINNAVAHELAPGRVDEIDISRWLRALDINVLGYVRLLDAFVPGMLQRGSGYVVTTSSSLAILPNPATQFMLPYVASKGAHLGMAFGLDHALRSRGVMNSVFCPGLTATQTDGKPRPAVAGFLSKLPVHLSTPATTEYAASVLLDGMRAGKFLICSQPEYESSIVSFAKQQLDPQSQFQ